MAAARTSLRTPVNTLDDSFASAADARPLVERRHLLAGHPVRLVYAGEAMAEQLDRAFAHLREPAPGAAPALTCRIWDSGSSGAPPPPLPTTRADDPQGAVYSLDDGVTQFAYQPGPRLLSVFDRARAQAWFWADDVAAIPPWDVAGPLRQILHWWLGSRGLQQLHGGAVGTSDGGGVLLVGRGGSGKSTTTLATLLSPLRYAGDDYVAVDADAEPRVHSLYSSGKLDQDHLRRFPHLASVAHYPPDHDKAIVFVHDAFPHATTAGFALRAIVIPRVTDRRAPVARPTSPASALAALAPSTILQLRPPQPNALATMRALVARLPCYSLELGSDLAAIPDVLLDLVGELS